MLAAIWVTSACNMKCKYCYEGENKKEKYIKEDIAIKALGYIFERASEANDDLSIVFHGGEPLLNYNLIEFIISYADKNYKEVKVNYSITTNGYFLDEKKIKFLTDKIEDITVSLDGNKDINDLNRVDTNGKGTYDVVIKNLKKILKFNKNLRLRMTVTSNNVNSLYDSIVHFIKLGVKNIIPAVNNEDENWDEEKIQILSKELAEVKSYIEFIQDESIYVGMISKEEIRCKGVCAGGINSFHIDPNGDIYPCAYTVGDDFYKCGDVFIGLDNNKINEFNKINIEEVSSCEDCSYYNFCISKRCKFINKHLTGDYYKASPVVCNVERVKLNLCSIISNF